MVTNDLKTLYAECDALGLAELVRKGEVAPQELAETSISLIEEVDPTLNSIVIRTFDIARKAALNPPKGSFAGVPFLLKNIGSMWRGTPLTNGMSYMKDFVCNVDTELSRWIKPAARFDPTLWAG